MLLVVLKEDLALGEFTRQVVREHIDVHLELLGHSVLEILVQLAVGVQESNLIGAGVCSGSRRFIC